MISFCSRRLIRQSAIGIRGMATVSATVQTAAQFNTNQSLLKELIDPSYTNLTKSIISKIDRNLHLNQNHPIGIIKERIISILSQTQGIYPIASLSRVSFVASICRVSSSSKLHFSHNLILLHPQIIAISIRVLKLPIYPLTLNFLFQIYSPLNYLIILSVA